MSFDLTRLPTLQAGFLGLLLVIATPVAGQAQNPPPVALQSHSAALTPDLTFTIDGGADGPIEAGAWLPAPSDSSAAPLIVFSHGNGGEYRGHADTARALANAGFVVAALSHPGDNYRDMSRSTQLTGRAPQLSRLIDYMTGSTFRQTSPIAVDASRIGAFGFSAGGFTVTSAIGGVSDLDAIRSHCASHQDDFACRLLALQPIVPELWRPNAHDQRIRAAVIAAPALGYSFTDYSVAAIRIPVQLWQAQDDQILPSPYNVEPIRDRLSGPIDYNLVERAGHYDFLPPCPPALAAASPSICAPTPDFDRAAFHEDFNGAVVRFFQAYLG